MDRQPIDPLRADGRATYAELARQVGLSSPAVHERVGTLEGAGVITAYRAVIHPAAVDDTGVEEGLRTLPEVEDCWRVAGSEGYALEVRMPGIAALEATIGASNRTRGVARTRTTVVLSSGREGRHG